MTSNDSSVSSVRLKLRLVSGESTTRAPIKAMSISKRFVRIFNGSTLSLLKRVAFSSIQLMVSGLDSPQIVVPKRSEARQRATRILSASSLRGPKA